MNVGDRVCALGRGADGGQHYHGTVVRLTKTMIIVTSDRRGVEHRFSREYRESIPRSTWGGVCIATKCQKKS